MTIIRLVKALLDPVTRGKIVLVAGDDGRDAPCPPGLADHVALDHVPAHARPRHANLPAVPPTREVEETPRRPRTRRQSDPNWLVAFHAAEAEEPAENAAAGAGIKLF